MLIESTVHLPVSFAMLDGIIAWPKPDEFAHILIRWLHFVGGITWIGMLYFFNLVNVPLQKKLDADTKKKVNPDLLLPALWFFRWGAVLTVLAGLTYFAMDILKADVANANTLGGGNINIWVVLLARSASSTAVYALMQTVPSGEQRVSIRLPFTSAWPSEARAETGTLGISPISRPIALVSES